jgi:hypothetical protein
MNIPVKNLIWTLIKKIYNLINKNTMTLAKGKQKHVLISSKIYSLYHSQIKKERNKNIIQLMPI